MAVWKGVVECGKRAEGVVFWKPSAGIVTRGSDAFYQMQVESEEERELPTVYRNTGSWMV